MGLVRPAMQRALLPPERGNRTPHIQRSHGTFIFDRWHVMYFTNVFEMESCKPASQFKQLALVSRSTPLIAVALGARILQRQIRAEYSTEER